MRLKNDGAAGRPGLQNGFEQSVVPYRKEYRLSARPEELMGNNSLMDNKKRIYLLTIVAIACVYIIWLANSARTFGVFINSLHPCVQDPMTSVPCYGLIDIGIMIVAGVILVLCVILILVNLTKHLKSK